MMAASFRPAEEDCRAGEGFIPTSTKLTNRFLRSVFSRSASVETLGELPVKVYLPVLLISYENVKNRFFAGLPGCVSNSHFLKTVFCAALTAPETGPFGMGQKRLLFEVTGRPGIGIWERNSK